jgi:RNA-directed DNA polymerase
VIDKVYSLSNLRQASSKVCANKGAGGVDQMTVESWRSHEEQHLCQLRRLLLEDRYRSEPVRRVYIPKVGSAKRRPLGIPVVADRVCQQAVHQQLSPIFEESFFEDSYGFRPRRSTRVAARRIEELYRLGYRYVVDLDIEDFFGSVDHELLMRLVRQTVKDRRVLGLIRGWLKSGVMEAGRVRYQTSGTPQGGNISPLLSNIYLTPFDFALQQAGYQHVRYADDVLILCRSREEAESALSVARTILSRYKLNLSEAKTVVSSFQEGFDFLGFRFKKRNIGVARKSLLSFYEKVRQATRRQQGDAPLAAVIATTNRILVGWGQYHLEGQNRGLFATLDKWVRNRIRAYHRRRWRDRGRWKVFTPDDLSARGLRSLYAMITRPVQLLLF